ncbi:MAG: LCP family protein [Chloroflexi bacterium]|nr:LCP family protein [Chloroflexota bacterium]
MNQYYSGRSSYTQPTRLRQSEPIEKFQAVRIKTPKQKQKRGSCLLPLLLLLIVGCLIVLVFYLVLPTPVNFVVMGIDRAPENTALGRSDTIIMVTVQPFKPYVGMLSVPRDLWVQVPGGGENRINTPHFFAEGNQPGSGPQALLDTIFTNFQLDIPYYVRFKFEGFKDVVSAMGGVDLTLENATGGLEAGTHHLDGDQALAFVRDRAGSDDFFRMERGQIFVKAVARQILKPATWLRLPMIGSALLANIDTNLPVWQWPRIGIAVLRIGIDGIDNRTISRDYVTPFITNEGANVLLPRWELILPMVQEMFAIH